MTFGTLINRNPMRSAAAVMLNAERAASDFQRYHNAYAGTRFGSTARSGPRFQAVENENEYKVSAELPGVDPQDVEVFVEDGVLTVKGTRKAEGWTAEASDEENAPYLAKFERRIRFNGEIDEPNVQAKCANGLLQVTVPKPEVPEPEVRMIPVQVS